MFLDVLICIKSESAKNHWILLRHLVYKSSFSLDELTNKIFPKS